MLKKSEVKCDICNDVGYIKKDHVYVSCVCKLTREIKEYLGHFYKDAKYKKGTNFGKFLESNIYLDNGNWETFRSLVKTALLSECMRYKHITVTPHEVCAAYFDNDDLRYTLADLRKCDLLVLYINVDPDNKQYDKYLVNFLEDRLLNEKTSWVYSSIKLSSEDFERRYGNLGSYIIKKFDKVNTGN